MNKIVNLVNEWDNFEQSHPNADIDDFCRFYLLRAEQNKSDKTEFLGRLVPPTDGSTLLKTMGRIMAAFSVYHKAAMATTKLPFPEAFFYLNALRHMGEVKKTELINHIMQEYTTGIEAINKLIKAGFISEREDETDKRARLVAITEKGSTQLLECYQLLGKIGKMMFGIMSADSIKLCIQMLSDIEIKHSRMAMELKNKDFEEICAILGADMEKG